MYSFENLSNQSGGFKYNNRPRKSKCRTKRRSKIGGMPFGSRASYQMNPYTDAQLQAEREAAKKAAAEARAERAARAEAEREEEEGSSVSSNLSDVDIIYEGQQRGVPESDMMMEVEAEADEQRNQNEWSEVLPMGETVNNIIHDPLKTAKNCIEKFSEIKDKSLLINKIKEFYNQVSEINTSLYEIPPEDMMPHEKLFKDTVSNFINKFPHVTIIEVFCNKINISKVLQDIKINDMSQYEPMNLVRTFLQRFMSATQNDYTKKIKKVAQVVTERALARAAAEAAALAENERRGGRKSRKSRKSKKSKKGKKSRKSKKSKKGKKSRKHQRGGQLMALGSSPINEKQNLNSSVALNNIPYSQGYSINENSQTDYGALASPIPYKSYSKCGSKINF
tara:strand:+ start:2223 stop:3404 length:1182 start_codon:yes stop_codon:yes gene_type:complete